MAKVQIKFQKITSFGGFFFVEDQFQRLVMPQHPTFRLCSPDTVLRAMTELAEEDEVYSTAEGKAYSFNIASKLNGLLVYTAFKSGMLSSSRMEVITVHPHFESDFSCLCNIYYPLLQSLVTRLSYDTPTFAPELCNLY